MKTITQLLIFMSFFLNLISANQLNAQNSCSISLSQPTYSANGSIAIDVQANYPAGWTSSVHIDFGDGYSESFYNQNTYAVTHTYLTNGNYNVSAYFYSHNPSDSSFSCNSTSNTIQVSVTNVTTCNLGTSLFYYQTNPNTVFLNAYSNLPVTNEYFVIDGQTIPYADSTYYTFTTYGQHQICYYASTLDTLNSCSDNSCVIYNNTNNNTNCNLQVTVSTNTISSTTAQIYTTTNTAYNYSYLLIDGQQFSGIDTMTYVFNNNGQHQICYYASFQDSTSSCSDSACVIFNSSGGGVNNCQASFYLWQDSLNTNTSVWLGINNSSGTPPFTYFWNFGDGTTSNQPYPFHVYNSPGIYVICLQITDANGCTSTMCDSTAGMKLSQLAQIGSLTIYPPNTSVGLMDNQSIEDVLIMPNPADDFTYLNFVSKQNDELELEVLNLLGSTLFSIHTNCQLGNNQIKIPTNELSSGYFLLKIKKGKSKPIVLKLIRR